MWNLLVPGTLATDLFTLAFNAINFWGEKAVPATAQLLFIAFTMLNKHVSIPPFLLQMWGEKKA